MLLPRLPGPFGGGLPYRGGRRRHFERGGITDIAYTWNTGTALFARLTDGRIAVQKADGTIKTYRPYHPVVIPKKWKASSMRRVSRALKQQRKTANEIIRLTGGRVSQGTRRSDGYRSMRGQDVVQIKQ
jgi:hypothetical protein